MNNHSPFVTIIIPVYNVSQYIEKCLLSVLNQSSTNFEVVIVDDCGFDNSMELVQAVLDKSNKNNISVKIIKHPQNKGLSAARNTGVQQATGDYLFFLDSDDELDLTTVEVFTDIYKEKSCCDFYIADHIICNTTKCQYNSQLLKPTPDVVTNGEILASYIKGDWYIMAWGKFINRKFFLDSQLWFAEGKLHEDILFSYKLASSADTMYVIPKGLYIYNIRENSITTSKKYKNYVDIVWIIGEITKINKNLPVKTNSYIISLLFGISLQISASKLDKEQKRQLLLEIKNISHSFKVNEVISIYDRLKVVLISLSPMFQSALFKIMSLIYAK